LLQDELAKGIVVLAITRDVGDDAQVVGLDCGIAELLESRCASDEHRVEPGREGNQDKARNRGGIN